MIAINQDPACIQATIAKTYGSVEAWTKDLGSVGSGKKAIALLNRENTENTVTISFTELGLADVSEVRDLWSHEDISTGNTCTVTIPAHGTAVFTAEGTPVAEENDDGKELLVDDGSKPSASPMKEIPVNATAVADYHIGALTAKQLISKGAILLDVRTPAEYERGHLDGAINLDYTKIAEEITSLIGNKEQPIVVYCSAAKRSAQALNTLLRLGYTSVYNLGSMANYYAEPMVTFTTDTCRVLTAGDRVNVSFTSSYYDSPVVYVSAGKDSTLEDAVDTFATDLTWTEATIGWGSIHKNLSVDGNCLTLAGKTFTHGIGTHATSSISMGIPSGAKKFLAVAGCDQEKNGGQTMMFFVYIDGVAVDHSSLIKTGQHYVFDVDIPEGAKEIRLYADEGRFDGNTNDHADWCVAGFFDEITAN